MNRNEAMSLLHAYWSRQKDADKGDHDLLMFCIVQAILMANGWPYADGCEEQEQIKSAPMTRVGLPRGGA